MQQYVTIFVLCGESGKQLFNETGLRLCAKGLDWDRDEMIRSGQLAYWCSFLDVWSMGDSFNRFMGPELELRTNCAGQHQVLSCRRENIRIIGKPRNEEEERLKQILEQAKNAYSDTSDESYLFQIRSVFDVSSGFNP